jgi:ATP phosphoribosyltransferase
VLFQRPGDIVVGVRQGSLDFGITGLDMVEEKRINGEIVMLHEALGFGHCSLAIAVPEAWEDVQGVHDLIARQAQQTDRLRVATKFPNLTRSFLAQHGLSEVRLIDSEGTLEVAPTIGYADLIADLVSTGTTLRDRRRDSEITAARDCEDARCRVEYVEDSARRAVIWSLSTCAANRLKRSPSAWPNSRIWAVCKVLQSRV